MQTPESAQPVYVIYDSAERSQIARITTVEAEADKAQLEGRETFKSDALTAATQLYLDPLNYKALDDPTWALVAQEMTHLHGSVLFNSEVGNPKEPFFVHGTPTDLPKDLAEQRLLRLKQFPQPENLATQIELTEVLLANREGRRINANLFTEKSLCQPLWKDGLNDDPGDLFAQGVEISEYRDNLRRVNDGRKACGEDPDSEHLLEEARAIQEIDELDYTYNAIIARERQQQGHQEAIDELSAALSDEDSDTYDNLANR